jgi:Ca2+-binding RTX toxin-like protein
MTRARSSGRTPARVPTLVRSSATHTLADDVENLILTAPRPSTAPATPLNNTLTGNGGNNILNGSAGNDTMCRRYRATTLMWSTVGGDVVHRSGKRGTDLVQSRVTWTLAQRGREPDPDGHLGHQTAQCNTLDNVLTGNSANNTLSGGAGADSLIGGAGNEIPTWSNTWGDVVTRERRRRHQIPSSRSLTTMASPTNVEPT